MNESVRWVNPFCVQISSWAPEDCAFVLPYYITKGNTYKSLYIHFKNGVQVLCFSLYNAAPFVCPQGHFDKHLYSTYSSQVGLEHLLKRNITKHLALWVFSHVFFACVHFDLFIPVYILFCALIIYFCFYFCLTLWNPNLLENVFSVSTQSCGLWPG